MIFIGNRLTNKTENNINNPWLDIFIKGGNVVSTHVFKTFHNSFDSYATVFKYGH